MSLYEKQCPKCKETTTKFHLMMAECDDCVSNFIRKKEKLPDKYIEHALGILVLNPDWIKYQESLT